MAESTQQPAPKPPSHPAPKPPKVEPYPDIFFVEGKALGPVEDGHRDR